MTPVALGVSHMPEFDSMINNIARQKSEHLGNLKFFCLYGASSLCTPFQKPRGNVAKLN